MTSTEPRYSVVGDWLAEWADACTCGGLEPYGHEPECGWEPLASLETVLELLTSKPAVVCNLLTIHRTVADSPAEGFGADPSKLAAIVDQTSITTTDWVEWVAPYDGIFQGATWSSDFLRCVYRPISAYAGMVLSFPLNYEVSSV